MEPGERYWSLLKPQWGKIDIYGSPAEFLEGFIRVPRPIRNLFAAHWCQSEIQNGGLDQFFTNPTGVLSPEAVLALRQLDLDDLPAVVAERMLALRASYPREQHIRISCLDQLRGTSPPRWDPFVDLDERFFVALRADPHRFERAADAYALNNGG